MQLAMVGWSHHRTPVEVRERLAFSNEQVIEALKLCRDRFPDTESVLLSTCNRVELYCASNSAAALPSADELGTFLTEYHSVPYPEVEQQLTSLVGEDSIRHLFMVAASLDSMIVGETQILAQVKAAYETACAGESASAIMHHVFQHATVVARRVTNETDIHRRRISVPSVAVSEIATEFFERFDDQRILLIGAGDMGTETLRYLIDSGATKITIANRSEDRASVLAKQFGADVLPWDKLYSRVVESDLIVSVTGASQPIIRTAELQTARVKHGSRAVLILDLAVPRDFEPSVADLPDVYLFTVDDLQDVCDRNVRARKEQWPKAQRIVESETQRFLAETVHRGSGSTIKQLRDQAEKVKQDELQRLMGKLQKRGLDAESEKDVEVAFDRLVNKLLHPPLKSLRENANSSHHATLIDALRRLFQLGD